MLSHAWPFILVLVFVFGGGIVRSMMKALFGGVSAAINAVPTQNESPYVSAPPTGPTTAIGVASAEAVGIAGARATARRSALEAAAALATKGGGGVDLAELLREVAAAVPAPAAVAVRQQRPVRHEPAHASGSRTRHTPHGEPLAPLRPMPRLKALGRLEAVPPLESYAPHAPLAARRA